MVPADSAGRLSNVDTANPQESVRICVGVWTPRVITSMLRHVIAGSQQAFYQLVAIVTALGHRVVTFPRPQVDRWFINCYAGAHVRKPRGQDFPTAKRATALMWFDWRSSIETVRLRF